MVVEDIIKYILHSPNNTNPNVLKDMIEKYKGQNSEIDPALIEAAVEKYMQEHPVQPTPIDPTLTQSNQAADAKAVGDILKQCIKISDTIILDCGINEGG